MNEFHDNDYPHDRKRRSGGGRKDLTVKNPDLVMKLRDLVRFELKRIHKESGNCGKVTTLYIQMKDFYMSSFHIEL